MKRRLILAAAAVAILAHLWAWTAAWRNRQGVTSGPLELTERELRLPPLLGDSTALWLDLNWGAPDQDRDWPHPPAWLDAAKLTALGFDCHIEPTHPHARAHYAAQPARRVFVVLEFAGNTEQATPPGRTNASRLLAVDAGLDAAALRVQYPEPRRHVLMRGIVRATLFDPDGPREPRHGTPRVAGWIAQLLPGQLAVPHPWADRLQGLRRHAGARVPDAARFAVTVSWGTRYEPWIESVRLLPVPATPPAASPPSSP